MVEHRILQIMKENEAKRQELSTYMEKMLALEEENGESKIQLQK